MAKARRPNARSAAAAHPVRKDTPKPDWHIVGLAIAGMLVTAYLTIVAFADGGVAFCTEGSGCDVIQQSRFSTLLGIPMALWGFATYALLCAFAFSRGSRVKRWRRSWWLALLGLAISVYLTLVGLIALQAVCVWCLLSLAIITALFTLLTLRRPDTAPGMPWRAWLLNTGLSALVLVGLVHAWHSDVFSPAEDPQRRELAEHLAATGAKFYGASWCPTCQEQKRMFGASAQRLPYVECSPEGRGGAVAFECVAAEVTSYPTWVIRGRSYQGLQPMDDLIRLSGFRRTAAADQAANAAARTPASTPATTAERPAVDAEPEPGVEGNRPNGAEDGSAAAEADGNETTVADDTGDGAENDNGAAGPPGGLR